MTNVTPLPWHGVGIVLATVVTIFVLIAVTLKIAEWVTAARDELRDRYVGSRWKPAAIDWLMLPLWLALELVCLAAAIAFALFAVVVAYQMAKGARDWWHAGDRGRFR